MPRRRRGRLLLAATAVAVLGTALPSCAGQGSQAEYPDLHGERLDVVGPWTDTEQARFAAVLRDFTERTGATTGYTWAEAGLRETIEARTAAGKPPDVALLPQPGLLRSYAEAGRLIPLDAATERVVRSAYAPVWHDLGTVGGRLYGVWFKAAHKSLLWYDVAAFERAGLAPPERLADLPAVARTMRAHGVAPFSVGGKDQWTLTDWFENLYLQLSGPQAYDRLADHRLPWTDRSVTATLTMMSRLLAPKNLRGGVSGTLRTDFPDSVALAFASPAAAAMTVEGDFVASVIATRTDAHIGVDVDATAFPAARTDVPLIVGGGDVAVQMSRSPAAAAFLRYLASPQAAAVWASDGGYVSPNQQLDLAVYPDELSRSVARSLVEVGDGFRFDLSDLQPAAFGSTQNAGMQQALADFLVGRDVGATARRLERLADAAYDGASR